MSLSPEKANEIVSSGLSAYWDGYSGSSNPYTKGSPESKAWGRGWLRGRSEEVQTYGKSFVPISER